MDIKKPTTNNKLNTTDAVKPTSAHTYASGVEASKSVKHKNSKKKLFIIAGVVALVAIVAVFSFWVFNSFIAKNGEISAKEIDRYANGVVGYKAQNPDEIIGDDPKQVAIDDLVLNKALKAEAKANNKELTTEEVNSALQIPSDVIDTKAYIEGVVTTDDAGFVNITRRLNQEYRRKLQDNIIAKRKLLLSTVSFDTPYNYSQKTEANIAQVHQEGLDLLKSKMLPLYENKASIEQIANAADVNNINGSAGTPQTLKLYQTQLVTNTQLIENYSLEPAEVNNAIPSDLVKQLQAVSASTNDPAKKVVTMPAAYSQIRSTNIKDLDNVDYGAPVKDLRNTNELIAGLVNPGDYTQPFASKSGAHMIVRLEAKSGGNYTTWVEFLNKSREKYYKNDRIGVLDVKNMLLSKLGGANYKKVTMGIVRSTAGVAHATQTCSGHDYRLHAKSYKINSQENLVEVSGKVRTSIVQSGTCPNTINTTITLPTPTTPPPAGILGNCMNAVPSYSNPPTILDSAFEYVGAIVQPWDYENVNRDSNWGIIYFIKRRDNPVRTVFGSSTLRRDGPGGRTFGPEATLGGTHQLRATGYGTKSGTPYLSKEYTLAGAATQLTVYADAPPFVTDGQGRRWNLAAGQTSTKSRTASAGNPAEIEFRYVQETPPLPTCSSLGVQMSANPSTVPVNNSYNTTIAWSSSGATSATSSDLGSSAIGTSGSRSVTVPSNVSTKTYTIRFTNANGSVDCSTTVTVNTTQCVPGTNDPACNQNVPPPSVDIRANGDNGPLTLNPGDPLTLSWTSNNIRNSPEPICTASSAPPGVWGGNKAANSATTGENHTGDINPSITTITYTITCNGLAGSNPATATDSVSVSVNQASYYPWLQTEKGDIGSNGKITGQAYGPASNPSVNPGGRRYNNVSDKTQPVSEAQSIIAAKNNGGNFCSLKFYVLGTAKSDALDCKTGGYVRTGVDFGGVVAATDNAFTNNGNGDAADGKKCSPTDSRSIYNTENRSVVKTIRPDLDLGCNGNTKGPNGGGGIQKVAIDPYTTFNLSVPSSQKVTGKGTLFVKANGTGRQPANLKISSNILYPDTVSTVGVKPSELPNFSIVVDGDVYIDNAVTEIDAAIIASGTIYTCSESIATTNPTVTFNFGVACTNKLTVYGLLAAGNGIDFGRRAYDTTNPNANPAERIVLTYQSIMFPPPGLSRSDGNTSTQLQTDFAERAPILK